MTVSYSVCMNVYESICRCGGHVHVRIPVEPAYLATNWGPCQQFVHVGLSENSGDPKFAGSSSLSLLKQQSWGIHQLQTNPTTQKLAIHQMIFSLLFHYCWLCHVISPLYCWFTISQFPIVVSYTLLGTRNRFPVAISAFRSSGMNLLKPSTWLGRVSNLFCWFWWPPSWEPWPSLPSNPLLGGWHPCGHWTWLGNPLG